MKQHTLPKGIVSVLQTPFDDTGKIDWDSYERLIEDAVTNGVDGFLAPAVASEVSFLSDEEREQLCRFVRKQTHGKVAYILGASSGNRQTCQQFAKLADSVKADAYLVAIPNGLYNNIDLLIDFLQMIAGDSSQPMIIQDLRWNEDGLSIENYEKLRNTLPSFRGVKIETVPAGPKYTQIRNAFGNDFYICGGWAVPQMLEAMDRGVDALMPESSMVQVYKRIWNLYHQGQREQAKALFYRLLPVLSFTNQEIKTSIAFFKRLLVKRGIFQSSYMRMPGFEWDAYNEHIADELIEAYRALENQY